MLQRRAEALVVGPDAGGRVEVAERPALSHAVLASAVKRGAVLRRLSAQASRGRHRLTGRRQIEANLLLNTQHVPHSDATGWVRPVTRPSN